jgi:hypothetical protein
MPLSVDDLKTRLPPLNSQEAEPDPFIYAKFVLPGSDTAWYVMEGQEAAQDFVFFGFISEPVNDFGEFYLSQLQRIKGSHDAAVERDETFTPGRLTDVVPAPDV